MCAGRTVIVERVARCEGPVRFVAKRARGEVGEQLSSTRPLTAPAGGRC